MPYVQRLMEEFYPEQYFVSSMGLGFRHDADATIGWAEVYPSMWARGTRRPRLAVLATLADVLASHVPDGTRSPTMGIRACFTGEPPSAGRVDLVGQVLKVSRRQVIARTMISHDGRVFAMATTTFANRLLDTEGTSIAPGSVPESYDDLLDARAVDDHTLEVTLTSAISNPYSVTVQGGVQAFLAELAAEHLCPDAVAVDLDVRFLDRMQAGPLRAEATHRGLTGGLETVLVRLYDAGGDAQASIADVTVLMKPRHR